MTDFRIDVIVDPRRAKGGIDKVEKDLDRLDNRARGLGTTLGRAIGLLGGFSLGIGAIRNLALYEQALARAAATASATAEEFEKFRDVTQELGATTRFTAVQATEGLQFLAQAGFNAKQSIEVLDDTLLLAQVGLLDIGRAADIATNVLATFRAPVTDAGRFVDVLAKTATSANTNISQLGDAIKFVGPVAAGTGVTIEQTAAAIGVLSNAGLQATLAGTGLRGVIAELERPTKAAAQILRDLGVSEEEVKVSTVGLIPAIRRLKESGISTGEALAIFGKRAGPAFEVLANSIDDVEKLNETLDNAGGFAKGAAERIDDNLLGSLLRVKSAFEAVILSVGRGGGTSGLRGLLEELTKGLRFLAANSDIVIQSVQNLALFLGPRFLLGAVRTLTAAISANPLGLLLVGMSTAIAIFPEFQAGLDNLVEGVTQLVSDLGAGIDFSSLVVSAAQAVDNILSFFVGLGEAVGFVFDMLPTKQDEVGELLKKGFRDTVEAIIDYFLALAQTVGNILAGIAEDAVTIISNIGGAAGAVSVGKLDAADQFAENIESALLRSANRIATFNKQVEGNLRALQEVDFLPPVEISNEARELGDRIGEQFRAGFEEKVTVVQDLVKSLFAPEEVVPAAEGVVSALEQIAEAEAEIAKSRSEFRLEEELSTQANALRQQLDLTRQLREEAIALQELAEADIITKEELARGYDDLALRALEASMSIEAGFTRAFIKLRQEAEDFASVVESAVNIVADNFTDALVKFAETGKISFKDLASSIVSDLLRIIARLLVVQALSAVIGGGGGGVVSGIVGDLASSSLQSKRAKGGMVQPGQNVLVGENGPEIMRMGRTAFVEPNAANAPQAAPEVNVQVVNVDDPSMVTGAISSGMADDVILNVLTRNRDKVRRTIS